jgi:hypothetical protein
MGEKAVSRWAEGWSWRAATHDYLSLPQQEATVGNNFLWPGRKMSRTTELPLMTRISCLLSLYAACSH